MHSRMFYARGFISAICAMVMAAAPSAATGATGLERLLLIFLMKLSESQNVANNTYFSYDRFSDQSGKLHVTLQKLKSTANLQRNQTSERTQTPPNKSHVKTRTSLHHAKIQTNGGKCENTEQNTSKQRTMVAPAHNHAENFENLQELTLWMGARFTRPHGGRLMILPVDQNAGNCLVKESTCAPLQTSILLQDPPQEPAKE